MLTLGSGQSEPVAAGFVDGTGAAQAECSTDTTSTLTGTASFASPTGAPAPNLATLPPDPTEKPSVILSGPLLDHQAKYVFRDTDVYVDADVGPHVNSGAASMTVSLAVDGVTKATTQHVCDTPGCDLSLPFVFRPSDYTNADHTITATAVDATGVSTSSVVVAVNNTLTDLLPCTDETQAVNFPVYSLGPSFDRLPRTETDRDCEAMPAATYTEEGDGRTNTVSVDYGDCTVDEAEDPGGCSPPITVQTWPACERNRASYVLDDYGTSLPRQDVTIRGDPASWFDPNRLELYTGAATVASTATTPTRSSAPRWL
jgi:hypothetical protein